MSGFAEVVGIDYSGAEVPEASLSGLRVFVADAGAAPVEVRPPASPRWYWTRRGLAEWLVDRLRGDTPTLVGINHGFSFPLAYFERHGLPLDWPAFLDDFQQHWPTDERYVYVDFVRDGMKGNGAARTGSARWLRLTEKRAGGQKSLFQFRGPRSRAKAAHAGLPWLRYLRRQLGSRVHFWPFDGWDVPAGRSVIAEVQPALWRPAFERAGRTADQHDAFVSAAWLSQADRRGSLAALLQPLLPPPEREQARIEGWILGVPGLGPSSDRLQ